jgi:hypothetical protein
MGYFAVSREEGQVLARLSLPHPTVPLSIRLQFRHLPCWVFRKPAPTSPRRISGPANSHDWLIRYGAEIQDGQLHREGRYQVSKLAIQMLCVVMDHANAFISVIIHQEPSPLDPACDTAA